MSVLFRIYTARCMYVSVCDSFFSTRFLVSFLFSLFFCAVYIFLSISVMWRISTLAHSISFHIHNTFPTFQSFEHLSKKLVPYSFSRFISLCALCDTGGAFFLFGTYTVDDCRSKKMLFSTYRSGNKRKTNFQKRKQNWWKSSFFYIFIFISFRNDVVGSLFRFIFLFLLCQWCLFALHSTSSITYIILKTSSWLSCSMDQQTSQKRECRKKIMAFLVCGMLVIHSKAATLNTYAIVAYSSHVKIRTQRELQMNYFNNAASHLIEWGLHNYRCTYLFCVFIYSGWW